MRYNRLLLGLGLLTMVGCSSLPKRDDALETLSINTDSNVESDKKISEKKKEIAKNSEKIDVAKVIIPGEVDYKENELELSKIHLRASRPKEETGTEFLRGNDPLQPFNRRMYYFNYQLDKWVLLPAVNTYEAITPKPLQKGVTNFFSNLGEVKNFTNSVAQLEGKKAVASLSRFGINSTVGLLGLFDVATKLDIPKSEEDFGLTLAKYHVGEGPYLMLPGLGPSNIRDATGKLVDTTVSSYAKPYKIIDIDTGAWPFMGLNIIDTRKGLKGFKYYGTGSPFEYEYMRYLYTKYRKVLSENGDIKKIRRK